MSKVNNTQCCRTYAIWSRGKGGEYWCSGCGKQYPLFNDRKLVAPYSNKLFTVPSPAFRPLKTHQIVRYAKEHQQEIKIEKQGFEIAEIRDLARVCVETDLKEKRELAERGQRKGGILQGCRSLGGWVQMGWDRIKKRFSHA